MCLSALKCTISAGTAPTAARASDSAAETGREEHSLFLLYSHKVKAKRRSLSEEQKKKKVKTPLCSALQGNSTYKDLSVWVSSAEPEIRCLLCLCDQQTGGNCS